MRLSVKSFAEKNRLSTTLYVSGLKKAAAARSAAKPIYDIQTSAETVLSLCRNKTTSVDFHILHLKFFI